MMCLGAFTHFLICLLLFWQCGRGNSNRSSIHNLQHELLQNNIQYPADTEFNNNEPGMLFILILVYYTHTHNSTT